MYGFMTDIEKALLLLSLDEEYRDATRFFWLSDSGDPKSAFRVFHFKAVLFGTSSSLFVLNTTLDKHVNPVAEDMKNVTNYTRLFISYCYCSVSYLS